MGDRAIRVGYARVSTDGQDLTAQRNGLAALGVTRDRIYIDHGLTGEPRPAGAARGPGCGPDRGRARGDQAGPAGPLGARSRAIADELTAKGVKLNLGPRGLRPDRPGRPAAVLVLSMIAEFEADLVSARTREGMAVTRAKGRLRGRSPELAATQEAHLVKLYRAGEHTGPELAELFGVG